MNYRFEIALLYEKSERLWYWRVPAVGGGSDPRPEMAFDQACHAARRQLKKDVREAEKRALSNSKVIT